MQNLSYYKLQTWELYIGGVVLVGLLLLVWRRVGPGAICAAWALLFLLPFLMMPEEIVLNLLSGPSRYLYMATAGSSLLLSWVVQGIAFWVRRWGHYLYSVILIGLLVSSYIFLQQVEALSLYSSGRYYIVSDDTEQGAERLKLAISRDRGRGIIDLEDAYVRLCQLLMSHGDPYFETFLEEALRIFPQNSAFKIADFVVDSMTSDPAIRNHALQAIDVLRQNGEGEDLIAQSYYNSGCGFEKKKEYERAVLAYGRSLEFALDRDPGKRFIVYADLSRAYYRVGDLPGAIDAMQKAVAVKADDANAFFTLGSLYHTNQQFDLAVSSLRQAIDLGASSIQVYLHAAQLHRKLDQPEEALQIYRQLLDRDLYDADGAAFIQIGVELFRSGDLRYSTLAYHKALAADDDNLTARTNLGWNLYLNGEYRAAIDAYRRVLAQQPGSTAQFNLGLAYLANGESDAAKATYARGVEEFGAGEAERIGAVDDLKKLIARGIHADVAQEILENHWE